MIKNFFYKTLEKIHDVDLVQTIKVEDIKDVNTKDGTNSGPSRSFGLFHIVENLDFTEDDKILDIGCGKGAAIIGLSYFTPCKVIDGLEYSLDIVKTCESNLKKIGVNQDEDIRCLVFHDKATEFKKYDYYNVFYMYDPFRGDTFYKTIDRIVESYHDNKRKITLIYANPYEESYLIIKGFKLEKEIETDFFMRKVKIYTFFL